MFEIIINNFQPVLMQEMFMEHETEVRPKHLETIQVDVNEELKIIEMDVMKAMDCVMGWIAQTS